MLAVEQRQDEYRSWLGEQIDRLVADPNDLTFSPRSRKEIEADLAKVREQIIEADAEVEEAKKAAEIAGRKLKQQTGRLR